MYLGMQSPTGDQVHFECIDGQMRPIDGRKKSNKINKDQQLDINLELLKNRNKVLTSRSIRFNPVFKRADQAANKQLHETSPKVVLKNILDVLSNKGKKS